MMQLTYKYRLYPNKQQILAIKRTFGCVRYVYNKLLEDRTKHYRDTGKWKRLDRGELSGSFLNNVDPGALEWAVSSLEAAYRNFFRVERTQPDKYRSESVMAAQKNPAYKLMDTDLVSYPKYKKRKTSQESYTTPLPVLQIEKGRIHLPYVGNVRLKHHRAIPEEAKLLSGTILKKPSGSYYLLVKFYLPEPQQKKLEVPLGVALVPGELAVRSDGEPIQYRHQSEELQKRIEMAYKTLKRRKPGSHRYEKQREYLASLYEHRANQRRDDLHKAARQITNAGDAIYMQQADVRGQLRTLESPKCRAILLDEASWTFSSFVKYKSQMDGKWFWAVPKECLFPTVCAHCGAKRKMSPDESWICQKCGSRAGLYENAAAMLRNIGLQYIQAKT